MLGGELTHHRGDPSGGAKPADKNESTQWTGGKTVLTDEGPLELDIARDRDGTFEPQLIPQHARRFTGFDEKILALYARGLAGSDQHRGGRRDGGGLHDQRAGQPARAAAEDHQTRGHFPNDEAKTKPIWLALRNITAKWQRGGNITGGRP